MALMFWGPNDRIIDAIGLGMIGFALIHLAIESLGWETLATFMVMQALTMGCFGLANTNFSAMAMERMGQVAGVASSIQGFVASLGGAFSVVEAGALLAQDVDGLVDFGDFVCHNAELTHKQLLSIAQPGPPRSRARSDCASIGAG